MSRYFVIDDSYCSSAVSSCGSISAIWRATFDNLRTMMLYLSLTGPPSTVYPSSVYVRRRRLFSMSSTARALPLSSQMNAVAGSSTLPRRRNVLSVSTAAVASVSTEVFSETRYTTPAALSTSFPSMSKPTPRLQADKAMIGNMNRIMFFIGSCGRYMQKYAKTTDRERS